MMKAVLFDVGGVLRDSRHLADESYKKAFLEAGIKYTLSPDDTWHLRGFGKFNSRIVALRAMLCVMRAKLALGAILEKKDAEERLERIIAENTRDKDETLLKKLYERSSHWFYDVPEAKKYADLFPDAKKVIPALFKKYILGTVSNSRDDFNRAWFSENGILGYFHVTLGAGDIKEKKPSPGGILLACKKLGINPEESAYVGDSASDIIAAKRAGCKSIAALWGMGMRHALLREKPDAVALKFSDIPGILETW